MIKKKIVIIGSGIIGVTIAYELSINPEFDLTLIDQNPPAEGATGSALGLLMGIVSKKMKGRAWALREASLKRYHSLIPELVTLTKMDIPVNKQGILKLYFCEEERESWLKLIKFRTEKGYSLELWDQETIAEKCPHLNCNRFIEGLYSPQDLQVNPVALGKAMATGASLRGVHCHFGQKVEKLLTTNNNGADNGHCYQVQTKDTNFDADWVILAAGLGSTSLIKSLGQNIQINPVLGQALLLKSDRQLGKADFQPVITAEEVNIVPLENAKYWLGATLEFPDQIGMEIDQEEKSLQEVYEKAIVLCPELKQASIMLSWSGKRPRPEEKSAPVIEKLTGYDNIIVATGHYQNGILLAPATAQLVEKIINH